MKIVLVRPRYPFYPMAVEIGPNPDIAFLDEVMSNTYRHIGSAAVRDNGIIDLVYGAGDYDFEYIRPGDEGWLLLNEDSVTFYRENSIWKDWVVL